MKRKNLNVIIILFVNNELFQYKLYSKSIYKSYLL
ncbi:uncharacterized protein METZ01_LOCUS197711 [marine metagenome]|uniref:Uncharacterized protein n=1 Tax=marine metagenome TaxID=408172 RepID=A0A382E4R7_9ZZZZ